ncbi:MAG: OmpA family protein [Putridiphycobacter sp.]
MKQLLGTVFIGLTLSACVPLKKYQELEANYQKCLEEQTAYKSSSINYESKVKELETQLDLKKTEISTLKTEHSALEEKYKNLQVEYDKKVETYSILEKKYTDLQSDGSAESSMLIKDLEGTRIELQRKEDRLNELEKELNAREKVLVQKEKRIKELEDKIAAQEEATRLLKEKIAQALLGFKDKGLTVEERDGRIYVSMEAKLLFASGKTDVSSEGEKALIDLAKVLESQSDIDILVEGHTDADPLKSANHPTDNWELSVLRATSVVKIMLNNSQMDPKRIIAGGRSEYHPIDPNDKAKNRRIEIIITPDLKEIMSLISNG